jgi:glutaredoxin-related protein
MRPVEEKMIMITVYGMPTCPHCSFVEKQIEGNENFRFVDIGAHVKNLKEFLRIRDHSPVFDDAKKNGYAGIPCFVLEDGTVTLKPEDAGLKSGPEEVKEVKACRIDGSGC